MVRNPRGPALRERVCGLISRPLPVNIPPPSPSNGNVDALIAGPLPESHGGFPPTAPQPLDDTPDGTLVQQARHGSSAAFEQLVIRYRARIYTMIHHMTGNEADTWDLSQEVFIKAWRALPGFEERSQFSTWLHRIAHNATCDWLRRKRVRGGHASSEFNDATASTPEAGAVTVPHGVQNPDQALENKELGLRIRDALAELSPEHRAVILMKEIDGLSYQEIADAAGCSLGTVMSRLFYARKRLQALLADLHHAHTSQRQDTP